MDREEVRAWWSRHQKTELQLLTLRQVALALDSKEEVVTQLVRAGLIETQLHQCGRRKARLVTSEDVDRFLSRYCKLKALTDAHGIAPQRAYEWAVDHQVVVVTGPQVDGRRQYFALRPK